VDGWKQAITLRLGVYDPVHEKEHLPGSDGSAGDGSVEVESYQLGASAVALSSGKGWGITGEFGFGRSSSRACRRSRAP